MPGAKLTRPARTVHNLVADQALKEDADEAHEPVLHVLVLVARTSATSERGRLHAARRAFMPSQDVMQFET